MEPKKVHLVYFSATGKTEKVVHLVGEEFAVHAKCACEVHDVTGPLADADFAVPAEELCVVGVPSFGGRVPAVAAQRLRTLRGAGGPAVAVVTYGNRAQEDTLRELVDILTESGFVVTAAASVVAQHSIMPCYAKGRPNAKDEIELKNFAAAVWQDLKKSKDALVAVKLHTDAPYKTYHALPMVPKAGKQCTHCGACAASCPVSAIDTETLKADATKCIGCMHCTAVCPVGTRRIGKVMQQMAERKMEKACSGHKENEFIC